jgi:nucleoside-diphosphate-sugar epimerase
LSNCKNTYVPQETVLVSGGCGFIGTNLVRKLLKLNYRVRVIDNLSTGFLKNIEDVLEKVEFIRGDIGNQGLVLSVLEGVRIVFHLAAIPSVIGSIKNPLLTNDSNFTSTLALLESCMRKKVEKVIYTSSSSIYGDVRTLPICEDTPANPLSPYAVSKLAGEYLCRLFALKYNLPAVVVRLFNVYGPFQNPDSPYAAVIPKFIKFASSGKPLTIFGDGRQSRDFSYVEDVVKGLLLCASTRLKSRYMIFNISAGKSTTVLEIAKLISRFVGVQLKLKFLPPREGEIRHSLSKLSRARRILKYRPMFDIKTGLKKTVEGFSSYL